MKCKIIICLDETQEKIFFKHLSTRHVNIKIFNILQNFSFHKTYLTTKRVEQNLSRDNIPKYRILEMPTLDRKIGQNIQYNFIFMYQSSIAKNMNLSNYLISLYSVFLFYNNFAWLNILNRSPDEIDENVKFYSNFPDLKFKLFQSYSPKLLKKSFFP